MKASRKASRRASRVLLWVLCASACSKQSPPATGIAVPPAHRDEVEHSELPSNVRVSAQVIEEAGIKTARVTEQVLPPVVELTGELAADPDARAEVTPRSAGRVVEVHFKEGAQVQKGALLAVIESPEAARSRASVTSTAARAGTARAAAERLQRLSAKGLAAGQEARNAESEAQALEAEAAAAEQALRSTGGGAQARGRVEVRAPLTGFILHRDAVLGQAVSADHVLASIANLDEAYFLGRLFEKDIARMVPGAKADVRLNAYPAEVFGGTVESVGKQLDLVARTVIARIRVKDAHGALKVGLFGTAKVVVAGTSPPLPRVVVALGAVTRLAGRSVVFVAHPDGDFEVHPVTLGRSASGQTEVLSGLRAGEQVVTEGVFTLKSTVLKSTFGEEE